MGISPSRRASRLAKLLATIAVQKEAAPELVAQFQSHYEQVPREERPDVFDALVRTIELPRDSVQALLKETLDAEDEGPIAWTRQLSTLRRQLESPRLRAFRSFLSASGGLPFLLDLRADILAAQRESELDIEPLDEEIAHLFTSWFQSGFLFLREVTLESSFQQIRFLTERDMVHPMASLEEMGARLGDDRRLFALCHRTMPEEPVVFIEIALTKGIARTIHEILNQRPPTARVSATDTAVFYSINNTQNGLAGLGLGKALISRVVDVLRHDRPDIKVFSTLSPVPGMWERYVERILLGDDAGFVLSRAALGRLFPAAVQRDVIGRSNRAGDDFSQALHYVLSEPDWIRDTGLARSLDKPLSDLAYFYITQEQNHQGKPLNPVAAFHLGNGARVSRRNINFGANLSERGLRESCGIMVNYIYSTTWTKEIGRTMKSLLPWLG